MYCGIPTFYVEFERILLSHLIIPFQESHTYLTDQHDGLGGHDTVAVHLEKLSTVLVAMNSSKTVAIGEIYSNISHICAHVLVMSKDAGVAVHKFDLHYHY
jgi:hypothetical protein